MIRPPPAARWRAGRSTTWSWTTSPRSPWRSSRSRCSASRRRATPPTSWPSCATCCPTCVERGIKVISNAGGVNPLACKAAVEKLADELGIGDRVRVGVVLGDDIYDRLDDLIAGGQPLANMDTGRPLSDERANVLSANVYLGAAPVVQGPGARRQRRHHRPGDRHRRDPGPDDPRVRLGRRRLGPARRRDRRRPHHRVRDPVHRRQLHRLAEGEEPLQPRLPPRRGLRRRDVHGHQASGDGRPRQRPHGQRAAPLRDGHPAVPRPRLHRPLRLHPPHPGRARPGQGQRHRRRAAAREAQGVGQLLPRLPGLRPARRHRPRHAGQGREGGRARLGVRRRHRALRGHLHPVPGLERHPPAADRLGAERDHRPAGGARPRREEDQQPLRRPGRAPGARLRPRHHRPGRPGPPPGVRRRRLLAGPDRPRPGADAGRGRRRRGRRPPSRPGRRAAPAGPAFTPDRPLARAGRRRRSDGQGAARPAVPGPLRRQGRHLQHRGHRPQRGHLRLDGRAPHPGLREGALRRYLPGRGGAPRGAQPLRPATSSSTRASAAAARCRCSSTPRARPTPSTSWPPRSRSTPACSTGSNDLRPRAPRPLPPPTPSSPASATGPGPIPGGSSCPSATTRGCRRRPGS